MERSNQLSLIPALMFVLFSLLPAHASVAGYSYSVDYFKVAGSVNQQDDFSGSSFSQWYVEDGTVESSGGSAILKNPGSMRTMGTIPQEVSVLATSYSNPLNISVGSGNATATSHWITNVQPSLAQAYMMSGGFSFEAGTDEGEIYITAGIANANQITADAIGSVTGTTIPTGLFAFFEVGRLISDVVDTRIFQVASITDATLFNDGSLFLNLHYDDAAQQVSADIVFGNDENGTAWDPFNTVAIPTHPGDLEFDGWYLEADSFSAVPIPAALPLFGSALSMFGFMGWRRRVLKRNLG